MRDTESIIVFKVKKEEEKIPHTGDKASLTDADSSTDTIVGLTKNTPKTDFFLNRKNYQKHKNSKASRNMTKFAIRPSTRGL